MHLFNLNLRLFQSKLGRKFFTIFVGCALLPILTLSSLTYILVTHQIEDQTQNQLQRAAKSYGLTIYDRLLLVDTQLQLLAMSAQNPEITIDKLAMLIDDSFNISLDAVALVKPQTAPQILFGKMTSMPSLPSNHWPHLATGRSVVFTQPYLGIEGSRVYLFRAVSSQNQKAGVLLAEINPKYIWSLGDSNPLPPMTEFCVLNDQNNILISTISYLDPKLKQLLGLNKNSIFQNKIPDSITNDYMASSWTLFLKPSFNESGWKIILTQSNTEILQPIYEFRRAFLLSILLTFWIILLMSIRYIRKNLIPLKKLKMGTERILNGEFETPVDYHSGDEFDDLIYSFNQMSSELGWQVKALKVIAQIGKETSAILDPKELLEVELAIIEEQLTFSRVLVCLADSEQRHLKCTAWFGWEPSVKEHLPKIRIDITKTSEDDIITATFKNKKSICWQRPNPKEEISEMDRFFLRLTENQMLFCVPIIYESKVLGLLVVESPDSHPLTTSEQELIKGIAAQTASGIYNSVSFKKLQNSETRFRTVFDNTAAGMCLADAKDTIIKVNTRFGDILGYQPDQLNGQNWQSICHPEDVEQAERIKNNLLSDGHLAGLYEMRLIHQDRRIISVLISVSLVTDDDKPIYYISQILDLSKQKAVESEKKAIEQQLMQSQKMEAMGTLAGGIAHDFNNIISAIMGQVELGQLQVNQVSKVKERFDGIFQAAQRAKALVQQILTFSRRSEHQKNVICIAALIKEALDLLRASLPANIIIQSNLSCGKCNVFADPNQIHQVIMNLGTNAYHAMADKGGTLSVRLSIVHVGNIDSNGDGTDLKEGKYVKIAISDTGYGISKENLKRIFDPYFTTKKKGKGTGLGLAMVHGIIKEHQGTISVKSQVEKGSTFEILLPQLDESSVPKKIAPQILESGKERILFIDDETIIIELGTDMLTHLGYEVESFQDPLKALSSLKSEPNRYDLVITDFNMPKMNGDMLAQEIEKVKPDLPIILCSGYQEWSHPKENLPVTLKAVLIKPFTLKELTKTIREALS